MRWTSSRAIGQQIAPALRQPAIIENKPGAGTNIALKALIESPPDGHTLMLTANSIAANPTLYQPPPFDMARDASTTGTRPTSATAISLACASVSRKAALRKVCSRAN